MKAYVELSLDYIMGYLRYGHKEGIIEIPEEDIEIFNKNKLKYIEEKGLHQDLEIVVDDYRIEDYGELVDVNKIEFLD